MSGSETDHPTFDIPSDAGRSGGQISDENELSTLDQAEPPMFEPWSTTTLLMRNSRDTRFERKPAGGPEPSPREHKGAETNPQSSVPMSHDVKPQASYQQLDPSVAAEQAASDTALADDSDSWRRRRAMARLGRLNALKATSRRMVRLPTPANDKLTCTICNQPETTGGSLSGASKSPSPYETLVPYKEFRTVTVRCGHPDEVIECTLGRHCISHPPRYEALSYEWGRPAGPSNPQRFINLSGTAVVVTENLWEALKHLRQPEQDRVLWIDALCIWQSNTQERTEQVARMALIYSSAFRVISWVGTLMQDVVQSSMLFLLDLFTDMSYPAIDAARKRKPVPYDTLIGVMKENAGSTLSLQKVRDIHRSLHHWQEIAKFFSLSYWKRLWIVQEVVLSRDLIVQCGNCFIGWDILSRFLEYLRSLNSSEPSIPEMPQRIRELAISPAAKVLYYKLDSGFNTSGRRLNLIDSLVTFMHSRCGDPRDKVYGLLGIASDAEGVDPDYHRTPLQLYEKMASTPQYRTDDQLVGFSQLVQRVIGGLVHSPSAAALDIGRTLGNVGQMPRTFYTRAVISGTISLIGDAFTTPSDARDLLIKWYDLYFHRIQTHKPGDDLPTSVRDALKTISKDFKRATVIDSRMSYSYVSYEKPEMPSWSEIVSACANSFSKHASTAEASQTESSGKQSEKVVGNEKSPTTTESSKHIPGTGDLEEVDCGGSEHELCECMRTTTLPSPPRWAIGSRGQVGLVPGTAREGDVICHFRSTDVAVVVRRMGSSMFHSIVGGAIIMRQWDEEAERIHERSPILFKYSTGTRRRDFAPFKEDVDQMSFHLDLTCLRLLTCEASDVAPPSQRTPRSVVPTKHHYQEARRLSAASPSGRRNIDRPELSFRSTTPSGLVLERLDLPHLRTGKANWGPLAKPEAEDEGRQGKEDIAPRRASRKLRYIDREPVAGDAAD